MKYICGECDAVFETPIQLPYEFEHAFGVRTGTVDACPKCHSGWISEAKPCKNPRCHEVRREGETLCDSCRADLLHRICAFFDTLTAEEEAQFEEWMDGSSISHRNEWEKYL